jgi:hypothetical protein
MPWREVRHLTTGDIMKDRFTIELADAVDVVAAVPHYLGFHPTRSLIIACVTAEDSISHMIREDLGPCGYHTDPLTLHTIRRQRVKSIVLVVVDDVPNSQPLSHSNLVRDAQEMFEKVTGNGVHALWASSTRPGGTVRCYDDSTCGGSIPDVPSDLAVLGALVGKVVYGSRDDIAELFQPSSPKAVARRSSMLDVAIRQDATSSAELYAAVLAAIKSPPAAADDDRIVRLGLALSDYRVRDAVLSLCLPREDRRAEQLWLTLARELPEPERAEAATLVAVAAWMRGINALANVALDVAVTAQPGHTLAGYLRTAFSLGIPREAIEKMITNAANDALVDLKSD